MFRTCTMMLDAILSEGGALHLRSGNEFTWAGDELCRRFGGWTMYPSQGCWINSRGELELDTSVTVLVDIRADRWGEFVQVARKLAAGQQTVRVTNGWAGGEPMILSVCPVISACAVE